MGKLRNTMGRQLVQIYYCNTVAKHSISILIQRLDMSRNFLLS
jgi:hypothetical protein